MKIVLAHYNPTLTFVSILNIGIQIGSTLKSNMYPIHEYILNIHNHEYNFSSFESNPNVCIYP